MRTLALVPLTLIVPAAHAQNVKIQDLSVYTKLKSNFLGRTQLETGLSANLWKHDRFTVSANAGWQQSLSLPRFLSQPAAWTAGVSLKYRLTDDARQFTLYTKTKHDLVKTWQQETGLSATLWKKDRTSVGTNVGYVQNYPFKRDTNSWTIGLQLNVKI